MPNRLHAINPNMPALCEALRAEMIKNRHTQIDVAAATGVDQSQISRVLRGQRKRFTPAVGKLCQYAKLNMMTISPRPVAEARLSQVLREAVGDNPAAALALARVIESLTPLLKAFESAAPTKSTEPDYDESSTR